MIVLHIPVISLIVLLGYTNVALMRILASVLVGIVMRTVMTLLLMVLLISGIEMFGA